MVVPLSGGHASGFLSSKLTCCALDSRRRSVRSRPKPPMQGRVPGDPSRMARIHRKCASVPLVRRVLHAMIEGQSSTGDGCARSAEENSMTTPRRALALTEVQQEYFGGPLEIQYPPHAESLPKIASATDVAEGGGLPVVVVQHTMGVGAPVFDPEQSGFQLHPEIDSRRTDAWKSVVKQYVSI